ncbi:RTA1-domain-containing protein [Thozetella sp. PMI_491]|nr:RTA1-domain-containing protein [Thozetella sp. PMI_491]
MPTLETFKGVYLWHYVPSLPAAVVFAILFTIAGAAHAWKMYKTKLWFCMPFVFGGFFETIGYIARALAVDSTGALAPFLVQAAFLLLPPVLFAASLYMVYSRVVRAVQAQDLSLIPPRWTTIIFVVGDLLCLNIQSNGAGLLAKPKTAQIGNYLIVAGLLSQLVVFAGFMLCCIVFHHRFRAKLLITGTHTSIPWQSCLNMLYTTSLAIMVRNIFRVIEFFMGDAGYLSSTEWPTYVFDGALMFLVMIGFFIWYPSHLQPAERNSMIELTSDGASISGHNPVVKRSESTP